jgi:hypothetical protein
MAPQPKAIRCAVYTRKGYINQDKKLVIVLEEAESVRWIFQRYLELGAIGPLLQELDRVGIKTKPRRYASGRVVGGGRFGKGGLNHLLKNRCYIGEVVHHGHIHPGDHEPILDRILFDAVQAKLAANNVEKMLKVRSSPYLLTGLIFDSAGNRMSPSHTLKKGVRYRYYVSQAVEQRRKGEAGAVARVPAADVEALVGELVASQAGAPGTMPSREVLEAGLYKVTSRPTLWKSPYGLARCLKTWIPVRPNVLKSLAYHGSGSPSWLPKPRKVASNFSASEIAPSPWTGWLGTQCRADQSPAPKSSITGKIQGKSGFRPFLAPVEARENRVLSPLLDAFVVAK